MVGQKLFGLQCTEHRVAKRVLEEGRGFWFESVMSQPSCLLSLNAIMGRSYRGELFNHVLHGATYFWCCLWQSIQFNNS